MDETPLYQVVEWDKRHENFRSRNIDRCGFYCSPNSNELQNAAVMRNLEGAAVLGVKLLLMELCSRQPKPREGYLTRDGTPNGWRLSANQLAHLWKMPVELVEFSLKILSSDEVGFLAAISRDTAVSREQTPSDAAGSRESANGIAREDDERKKERKKEGKKEDAPPDENFSHDDAKKWIDNLLRTQKVPWSHDEDYDLSKLHPIPKPDRAVLSWAYALSRDQDGWAIEKGKKIGSPKQSRPRLLKDFWNEVRKWHSARSMLKAVNGQEPCSEMLTQEWVAAIHKLYGPEAWVPERVGELTPDSRREIEQYLVKNAN